MGSFEITVIRLRPQLWRALPLLRAGGGRRASRGPHHAAGARDGGLGGADDHALKWRAGAGGYREHDILIITEHGEENITKFPFGTAEMIVGK